VLYTLGYSANTLSLFAIILALTMVVDDAIVVVESVETLMAEGQSRTAATALALRQIAGPVIATTLVLLAVFVPVALLPGIVGELYRQFAVTLSTAVTLSSLVALTLTPALCAMLLRPRPAQPAAIFRGFNRGLEATRGVYTRIVTSSTFARGWRCWPPQARRPWWRSALRRCQKASCRRRIRATSLPAFSCRKRPRWSAPKR
jgi:multidrug efflux pump subunit AcrB